MSTRTPKLSVIMPVYNGAGYLPQAIRSVLGQTVEDVELVITNDGSTDNSDEVVRSFSDPRIRYIAFEQNRGADKARNAALDASTAPLVAMLDQDDEFHPNKAAAHLDYFERHPSVEATYNSRYDLLCSGRGIWQMFRPAAELGLADFVLGFPISPSEMVSTRELLDRTLRIDPAEVPFHGGEIVWFARHYMDGVRFGFVDQALNYRRHHPGRRYGDIAGNCNDYIKAQDRIFDDPRCPGDVRALRSPAHAGSYVIWGVHALAQGELELGRGHLTKAIALTPELIEGDPAELSKRLAQFAITDDTRDHEPLLRSLFEALPAEANPIASQLEWAIDHGLLIDGALAVIWDRPDDARAKFARAAERGAKVDEAFLSVASYHLEHFESDAGDRAADDAARRLAEALAPVGAGAAGRRLRSSLSLGRAFRDYQSGRHRDVPANVASAMAGDPSHSLNRGAWSILMRSLLKRSA